MKKVVSFILLALSCSLGAQNIKPIDSLRADLQSIINTAQANYGMNRLELSVIYDDNQPTETFYAGQRAPGLAVDTAKPWHYAQVSAGYATYIALKMIEEGSLDFNDSIGQYMDAPAMGLDGSIKVHQLLRHTSVLNEFWGNSAGGTCFSDIWPQNPSQLGCPQDLLSCLPANKASSGSFDRNNTNVLVLQFLIDSLAGHSYETEMAHRIFTPMGMTDSYLSSCKTVTIDSINGIWQGSSYGNGRSYVRYFSSNGANRGLIAKSNEVAQFYRSLFPGQLLSTAMMDSLTTIIPGSAQPQGSYSCATNIMGYSGYNTDIVRVIDTQGDTTWLYGKGGFGMNGHLTLHAPAKNYTISFAHNDRSSLLGQRDLAMDLFCYLNGIDSVSQRSSGVGLDPYSRLPLEVYPNPSSTVLKIVKPNQGQKQDLVLVDMRGSKVLEIKNFTASEIDMSSFPEGVYLLRLQSAEAVYQTRVIKSAL